MGNLRDSFDETVEGIGIGILTPADAALVEAGRKIADRIDQATETGEGAEVTKALYLTPHLVNILREMLATPASRKAPKPDGGAKGGKLVALQGGVQDAKRA